MPFSWFSWPISKRSYKRINERPKELVRKVYVSQKTNRVKAITDHTIATSFKESSESGGCSYKKQRVGLSIHYLNIYSIHDSISKSVIFYIGPTKEKFIIPIKILRRSPSYASNYEKFPADLETKLPRIDSNDFRNLENYLYDSDFDESLYGTDSKIVWKGLRNVYLLGSDWELVGLQELVVRKLKTLHSSLAVPDGNMPTRLLQTAERIYRLVPESDLIFRHYFIKTLREVYLEYEDFPHDLERKLVMNGGQLAGDIHEARIGAWNDLTTKLHFQASSPPRGLETVPEEVSVRERHNVNPHRHHRHYHHRRYHVHAHHHPPDQRSSLESAS